MDNTSKNLDEMPKKSPLSFQIDLKKFEKATDEEKKQQEVMSESTSFLKDGLRKLRRNPLAMGSIVVLLLIIVMIIAVPHVVPYSYSQIITVNGRRDKTASNMAPFEYSDLEQKYIEEGGKVFPHIMGTDEMGRDYFVRVVYGTRVSLAVGLFASIIVLIIGVLYGSISGYFGGKVDLIMMRIVDIISTIPLTLYVILIMQVLGAGIQSIIVALGSVYWVDMARVVRGQILSLKQQEFVLAAKTIGSSATTILFDHLIPNALGSILVTITMLIPSAIFMEAFLGYLGIGLQPPLASLGTMCNDASANLRTSPHELLIPALMICVIMFAFNFVGDGLRDALDPKLKK